MAHLLKDIYAFAHAYGMLGVFLLMAAENLAIPVPTEAGFLVANKLIGDGRISFWWAFTIINLGHLTGATIAYRIGLLGDHWVVRRSSRNRKGGAPRASGRSRARSAHGSARGSAPLACRAAGMAEAHRKLQGWYERHGEITVLLARLVGYVRPYSSFVAGFAGVRFGPFVVYTLLGSMVINLLSMLCTHLLVLYWYRFASYHVVIGLAAFVSFFGGAAAYTIYLRRQNRAQELPAPPGPRPLP